MGIQCHKIQLCLIRTLWKWQVNNALIQLSSLKAKIPLRKGFRLILQHLCEREEWWLKITVFKPFDLYLTCLTPDPWTFEKQNENVYCCSNLWYVFKMRYIMNTLLFLWLLAVVMTSVELYGLINLHFTALFFNFSYARIWQYCAWFFQKTWSSFPNNLLYKWIHLFLHSCIRYVLALHMSQT